MTETEVANQYELLGTPCEATIETGPNDRPELLIVANELGLTLSARGILHGITLYELGWTPTEAQHEAPEALKRINEAVNEMSSDKFMFLPKVESTYSEMELRAAVKDTAAIKQDVAAHGDFITSFWLRHLGSEYKPFVLIGWENEAHRDARFWVRVSSAEDLFDPRTPKKWITKFIGNTAGVTSLKSKATKAMSELKAIHNREIEEFEVAHGVRDRLGEI